MYKNLYDCFRHWYNPDIYNKDRGVIWLYSDPHFGDPEMPEIRKNYISDEEQIKRINSKVGKYDTLIILGDIGDTECVAQLKGHKVLVMGNHDKGASKYLRQYKKVLYLRDYVRGEKKPKTIDNRLFDEVYEGPLFISEKIVLSHEPLDIPYALSIHGHTHSLPHEYDKNHVNVVAEAINYTPVRLSDIIESGKLKGIDSIHRVTIDTATEKAKKGKKNKWKK